MNALFAAKTIIEQNIQGSRVLLISAVIGKDEIFRHYRSMYIRRMSRRVQPGTEQGRWDDEQANTTPLDGKGKVASEIDAEPTLLGVATSSKQYVGACT